MLWPMHVEIIPNVTDNNCLFLHGNLASNRWWVKTISEWQKIAREEKRNKKGLLILAEWRGCGQSSPPSSIDDLHPDNLALDHISLLEGLSLEQADLVGHSTGGLIALAALSLKPKLFRRAVLLDTVPAKGLHFPPEAIQGLEMMRQDRHVCAQMLRNAIMNFDYDSDFFVDLINDAMNCHEFVWTGIPKILTSLNIESRLSSIRHPILIVHGKKDVVIDYGSSLDLSEKLANSQIVLLEDAGHSPNLELPICFARMLDKFFSG